MEVQVKLLRVLQERVIERLGERAARQGRRPHHRGHEPQPRGRGPRQDLPRGSVLSPQRVPHRRSTAARADRRHPGAGRGASSRSSPDRSARRSSRFQRRACASCSATPGRATSASCAMSSNARSSWQPAPSWWWRLRALDRTADAPERDDADRARRRATSAPFSTSTGWRVRGVRRRGGTSGPQTDNAREPDGQARHRAHEAWWAAGSSGDRLGTVRRHAASSAVHARRARLHVSAVHGAARHRSRARTDARVAADELQPVELGELRRPRPSRRSERARSGNGSPSTRRATGSSCRTVRIFLLTHLRYLGYGFNPVSFFYCFDRAERLQVVLAEVSNTFGGSHNYWLRPDPASRTFRAAGGQVPLRLAVHAGRPRVHVRLHAASGPPRGAHGDQSGRARWASTRRCRSNAGPGTRRRSGGCWCGIPR